METKQAVVVGALVVGAVVWWLAGHPGYESREQRQARIEALDQRAGTAGGPTLYRCLGPDGVNIITDTPPPGRKCAVVTIRDDQNVVSLDVGPAEPAAKGKERDKKR